MIGGQHIWKWGNRISPVRQQSQITLGEADTPLVRSRRIGPAVGLDNLYFKMETSNPSGSYKDRFAAVAVSDLLARGRRRCLATSSGNTGAALAAYCAAAGIECVIAILETTPAGKLTQMLAYGAELIRVRRFGVDPDITKATFDKLAEIGEAAGSPPQITAFLYSPIGMTGVQTISYELAEQFAGRGGRPDRVFVPAGGGGLALAVALGFEQVQKSNDAMPRVDVVQPEGNDTIASPLRGGALKAREVDCTTNISGLQVATVLDGDAVISHCRATGGTGHVVTDESIWKTQQQLACDEGLFCEPAGAVAVAGVLSAVATGDVDRSEHIVCLVTGSGFKDPLSVEEMTSSRNIPTVDLSQLAATLK